jgi:hypothetical protein
VDSWRRERTLIVCFLRAAPGVRSCSSGTTNTAILEDFVAALAKLEARRLAGARDLRPAKIEAWLATMGCTMTGQTGLSSGPRTVFFWLRQF